MDGDLVILGWQAATVPLSVSFGERDWIPDAMGDGSAEQEDVHQKQIGKIIVVDDESVIAETVVEILRGEGFETMAVPNGEAAVELAKSFPPDVVLSDVIMPGLNGIETGIRVREIVPSCKIILFSGHVATGDLLENAGRQGHRFEILAKPIRPEELISVIRASLGYRS